MKGIRGIIGSTIINNALDQFGNIVKSMEDGINHCKVDIDKHHASIEESHARIEELNGHVAKAERVKERIKMLID